MSLRKGLLGMAGALALVAGVLLFAAGGGYSSNWARWFFGPLLWFLGGALVIASIAGELSARRAERYTGVERRRSGRAAKKAS